MLSGGEQTYKWLQNLNKGLMGHSKWLMDRRSDPKFTELYELVIKTTRSVNRVMREMNNEGPGNRRLPSP